MFPTAKEAPTEETWVKEMSEGIKELEGEDDDEDAEQNEEAKMEEGRFFMYHRVWTKATLESERKRRRKIHSDQSHPAAL